ncbi:hypothetical protein [Phocaeicola sp.]|uniref:hypothetical protein n=1 Tax=Phocaeicola sp. TaxID=2773926 RepID=UPI0023D2B314|nr:hypothetical protein [Phocaeicola sp.]MDE5678449.1 hypothetical protein [Phocaeicola sp.]
MKQSFFISLFFLFLMSSCQNKESDLKIDWNQYPTVELANPKQILFEGRNIETEQHLEMIDNKYFFFTESFNQLGELHLYQMSDDTLKWEGLITQKGEGPLEMFTESRVYSLNGGIVVLGTAYRPQYFVLPADRIADRAHIAKWEKHTIPNQVGL